jgi:hypothetical protein
MEIEKNSQIPSVFFFKYHHTVPTYSKNQAKIGRKTLIPTVL